MKTILTSAVALTLLIGSPALAQDRDHHGGGGKHGDAPAKPAKPDRGGGGGHDRGGGGDRGDHRGGGGGADRGDHHGGGGDRGGPGNDHRNPNGNGNGNHNPNGNGNHNQNGNNNRNPNWNGNNNNRNPNWNRGQQRSRQFDRRQYQRNFQAQRRFRVGAYHRPSGWFYRRWSYGQILPFAFFARNYWLNDYYAYDLMAPPYGYEWVRYGDDAVLVDLSTGAILQVSYGVFY